MSTEPVDTLAADSPVAFPAEGPLPAKYPPDRPAPDHTEPEEGYYLFSTPERSLEQIRAIQAELPAGQFTPPPVPDGVLARAHRLLHEGGDFHLLGLGDSIVNDTMRSGWLALLQQAYPQAQTRGTVCVRGGGGCQHYREEGRIDRWVVPRRPDLVFIGGISQADLESIAVVVAQLRAGLPEVEILLGSGTFGTVDPRDPAALAAASYSGTGAWGEQLRALAAERGCAYLDLTSPWAEYLCSTGLHPHLFYRDRVHANEFGEQILARIMMSFWERL